MQAAVTPAKLLCFWRMAAACCCAKLLLPAHCCAPVGCAHLARAALQVWSEPEMVEAAAYEFADTAKYVETGEVDPGHLLD